MCFVSNHAAEDHVCEQQKASCLTELSDETRACAVSRQWCLPSQQADLHARRSLCSTRKQPGWRAEILQSFQLELANHRMTDEASLTDPLGIHVMLCHDTALHEHSRQQATIKQATTYYLPAIL